MVAGFEDPTGGEIVLDGVDLSGRPPFERDTNMMFQDLALFPHYSVRKNIEYGPRQQGVPKDERRRMAEEMLEMVRLSGYGDRAIEELSGGEKQRVALARCLINEPKLVLFDEPLASLDRQLRRNMTTELRNIQDRTGSTFLYVTHNQEVALSVSDRVIVLNHGEIEQIGTPDDLYNDPRTEFVANFVGDMNLFTTTVRDGDGPRDAVDVGANPIPVPAGRLESATRADREMRVGVRPHDVEIRFDRSDVSDCYVEGVVRGSVFDGDRDVVSVETALGDLTVETTVTADEGSTVYLECSPRDMHFYAPDGTRDE
jgi:spermidine/putrescine transport system ATP-binding protein